MKLTTLTLPAEAVKLWPQIEPMLATAVAEGCGERTTTDYLTMILTFQAQLWVFRRPNGDLMGVGLTEILTYHQHKTLHIIACAGNNWDVWAKGLADVEVFAKENQCVAVEQWGRRGWTKTLPKLDPGYEIAYYVMRKKL